MSGVGYGVGDEDNSETYSTFSNNLAGARGNNSTFTGGGRDTSGIRVRRGRSGSIPPPPSTPYLSDYCGEESEILSDFAVSGPVAEVGVTF